MCLWPFRKHQSAKDKEAEAEAELARARALRVKTEQIADKLERYANQLELALDRKDRGRDGRT